MGLLLLSSPSGARYSRSVLFAPGSPPTGREGSLYLVVSVWGKTDNADAHSVPFLLLSPPL